MSEQTVTRTAEAATRHMAASAEAVKSSAQDISDSADRTTTLAADRTLLAAERTYAAWVRTALSALASGIGARTLLVQVIPEWLARVTGSMLILFAGFCLVAEVWRQLQGVHQPRPDFHPIPHWLLVGVNGFLLLVTVAALVGVWAA